jgi:trk system potassium uptake protein TrkH
MGAGLSFTDALFESVSGVTTTGLTTTETVADRPVSFLIARAWLQWYGGLGIVVLSVALLMRPGLASRRLVSSEEAVTDLATDTRTHARQVLAVYSTMTAVAVLALFLAGLRPLAAITYALSAVSTGGFAIDDASLSGVAGWTARGIILFSALLGACSFAAYYRWLRGTTGGAPWHDMNGQALLLLTFLVSLALTLSLRLVQQMDWGEAVRQGLALGVSTQTTTGFTAMGVAELPPVAKAVQIFSMFIGGDLGSTAGGIKIFRFLIVLRVIQHLLARTSVTAHTVLPRRLGGDKLPDGVALDALVLVGLFVATIFLSWSVFLAYDYEPLDSLFDVVSATCTVGLSTGVTGPDLPGLLKGVLCLDMLLGRLEMVAVLVLVFPATWLGKRANLS